MTSWTCAQCGRWFVMNDAAVAGHKLAYPRHRVTARSTDITPEQEAALNAAFPAHIGSLREGKEG